MNSCQVLLCLSRQCSVLCTDLFSQKQQRSVWQKKSMFVFKVVNHFQSVVKYMSSEVLWCRFQCSLKGVEFRIWKMTYKKKCFLNFFSVLLHFISYFTFSNEYFNTVNLPNSHEFWDICRESTHVSKQKVNERFHILLN